ncbi:UDP-2,4-diacetamido-2,4,6-trideoxy-beta-L-altropyranose hydrolase [Algibacter sp. L1A34]|uniref:UDP-2,4-diacetamido-2,4, 6-trideoxy-beta-L-altropyranose hydrolase n=1 Tax=Algibacter sp. L1A34 TaxID=2686365 RepID=UPI00131E2443|nr:UDP-2,4-diacetamido-2,4,6-trideoxy-beta-L-altropyranose hydrolase [Algibacter sp. L1A34]
MTKKIIFRADGNSTMGLGHLYRLFALVEMYKSHYDFLFLTKENSVLGVIPKQYIVNIIPNSIDISNEPEWIGSHFAPKDHIIIADGYQFVSSYQKKIKKGGFSLIYVDDLIKEHMFADIVINHSPHALERDFIKEDYTKLALGTKFALLRPLFLKEAKQDKTINKIDTAFVCFGGADLFNLSLKAVQALLKVPTIISIHVVLGAAYKHREIFDLENQTKKLHLHKNLNEEDLCNLMQSCNISIAPSSTILYEICSVKMPILSGHFVDNQKGIYKELAKQEVIFKGGNLKDYSVLDFEEKINKIIKNHKIDTYLKNQKKLFDGKSKVRFLGIMNKLNISFRKAKQEDLMQVYSWSNDAFVRKNSYDSKPIELKNHKKWYLNKIKDSNTLFLLPLINNKPAGVVRYDITETHAIVGVLVSKDYRGQKLASQILINSAKLYFKNNSIPILAYIKKENTASVKSFENARYTYFKDEIIKGSLSFVYKLEKSDVIK